MPADISRAFEGHDVSPAATFHPAGDGRPLPYAPGELIPQAGRMVLLDEILEAGENHIVASLTVRPDGWFSDASGAVPAWVGIEYMAQTVAAHSGYHRRRRGQPVDLGFLLGTRHYDCSVAAFPGGARLSVRAEKLLEGADGMAVFECRIAGDRGIAAVANLNVFLPPDSGIYLAEKAHEQIDCPGDRFQPGHR
jgi:predicted hotdog family 3-hydroxylacyl-ACP dehydratase